MTSRTVSEGVTRRLASPMGMPRMDRDWGWSREAEGTGSVSTGRAATPAHTAGTWPLAACPCEDVLLAVVVDSAVSASAAAAAAAAAAVEWLSPTPSAASEAVGGAQERARTRGVMWGSHSVPASTSSLPLLPLLLLLLPSLLSPLSVSSPPCWSCLVAERLRLSSSPAALGV